MTKKEQRKRGRAYGERVRTKRKSYNITQFKELYQNMVKSGVLSGTMTNNGDSKSDAVMDFLYDMIKK